jgi:hypothetical protein
MHLSIDLFVQTVTKKPIAVKDAANAKERYSFIDNTRFLETECLSDVAERISDLCFSKKPSGILNGLLFEFSFE